MQIEPYQGPWGNYTSNGGKLAACKEDGSLHTAIREDCKRCGLKVALVCSSGIACHVYERSIASTAHSYYALGAADMPSEKLILRAISDVRT